MAKMDARSKLAMQVELLKTQRLLKLILSTGVNNLDELVDIEESEIEKALNIIQKIFDRTNGKKL